MKKLIHSTYFISIILVIILICYIQKREGINEFVTREANTYSQFTDYTFTTFEDASAPIGIVQEYRWVLKDIPERGSAITFYVIHQNIEIYVGDQLLYHLYPSERNTLARTVGCDWAKAFLHETDNGKEVRILVYPIYETSVSNSLTIYTGDYGIICNTIIQNNIFILLISMLAIIIGLVFILFVLLNIRNADTNRSLALLGMFSIFSGMWKITDMSAAPLIFKSTLTLSALSIISLNIMMSSFVIFVREHFPKSKHRTWDFIILGSNIECIIVIFLQFIGVVDLRETLSATHVVIVIVVLGMLYLLTLEVMRGTLSKFLKITILCCTLCLVGSLIDIIMYYRSGESGSMIYCLLAFIIYVILMGYMTVKETLLLIEYGKEAKKYEDLAYHDELTGLYNRAFYSQYLNTNNLQYRNCYIVMLDVNDLKQCNDSIGHEHGDQLIKNSASFIEEAFSQKGNCIRMGGDEFCVIFKNYSEGECKSNLNHFDELINQFNSSHPECFPIHIAYGYAHFDERLDFDFSDTLRRADKAMYQMKNEMKNARKHAQH